MYICRYHIENISRFRFAKHDWWWVYMSVVIICHTIIIKLTRTEVTMELNVFFYYFRFCENLSNSILSNLHIGKDKSFIRVYSYLITWIMNVVCSIRKRDPFICIVDRELSLSTVQSLQNKCVYLPSCWKLLAYYVVIIIFIY